MPAIRSPGDPLTGNRLARLEEPNYSAVFRTMGISGKAKTIDTESVIDPKISIHQYYERCIPQKLCSDTVQNV
jgi:hypothetical protein